ncbi:MAG: hypothetical protein ACLUFW_11070 [Alistipes sp.]
MPLYVRSWIAVKPQNAVERALKFIPAAFIVFFLLSTLRGYVQPQWVIVAVFGLLYTALHLRPASSPDAPLPDAHGVGDARPDRPDASW